MTADARPRRWPSWQWVLAGLVGTALVAAGAWAVFFSDLLSVRTVDVAGAERLAAAQVRRAAAVPLGEPLATVDLSAITSRVEALPGVRDASVGRQWPHTVLVRISERVPVAVVGPRGSTRAVDAGGAVFAIRPREAPALPRIVGADEPAGDAVVEAARVVAALPADLSRRVDQVEARSPDSVTLHLRGGDEVVWGSADRSATKARVLAVLLRRPGTVYDVSVPEQPTSSG